MTRRVAIACASAALALACGEALSRLILGERFHPGVVTDLPMGAAVTFDAERGWRGVAGLRARFVGPSFELPVYEYSVSLDDGGFRNERGIEAARSAGERILVLGDSLTWGWGVSDGAPFPAQLDAALGPGVGVLNCAVPGYSTDQEYLEFQAISGLYEPDHVLLGFALNDVEGNERDANYGLGKPRLVRAANGPWTFANLPESNTPLEQRTPVVNAWRRLASNSAMFQLLERRPERQSDAHGRELSHDAIREAFERTVPEVYSASDVDRMLQALEDPQGVTRELLTRLHKSVLANGGRLVVVGLPHHHDQYLYMPSVPATEAVLEAQRSGEPFRTRLSLALERIGADIGFSAWSVDQALLSSSRAGENMNVGDGHLNETGHRVVAAELARRYAALAAESPGAREREPR